MSNSTRKRKSRKAPDRPKKPYPSFPLSPHASGKWQKKIRGSTCYFGRWANRVNGELVRVPGDGWKEALELYKSQADDLHAGRTPRTLTNGLTLVDLCNRFLTAKLRKVQADELTNRSFQEYRETTDLLIEAFGKKHRVDDLAASDFERLRAEMAERWGPVRLSKMIIMAKGVFKYAFDNALIDRPVRYGSQFQKPGKAVLRRHKAANGDAKLFDAADLHKLISAADATMKPLILLGVNAGLGNADIAGLRFNHLDLERGWIVYPRPKTGIERRCPLWPETNTAIREYLTVRKTPKDSANADLVFLQADGAAWMRETPSGRTDTLTRAFTRLLRKVGVHRLSSGFYTLRHTHRMVSDGARDPVACDAIMGHSDPSMASHYRERIDDDRLVAVVEHVRKWLSYE